MTIVRFQPVRYKSSSNGNQIKSAPKRQPAVNISEDEKAFYISLATPGMSRSDFDIQLDNKRLIVKGKAAEQASSGSYSFVQADFEKSFLISDKVDKDRISALSKDGILRIELPKNDKVLTVEVS